MSTRIRTTSIMTAIDANILSHTSILTRTNMVAG